MLHLEKICMTLGDATVLEHVDLFMAPGETALLVGASGVGKTTLLRLIAGLDRPESGEIRYGDVVWYSKRQWLPPWARRVGMVFQDLVLWPHMTVAEHLDFVLRQSLPRLARRERTQRIGELLSNVGMAGLEKRLPAEMSGGQQQRLALLRAIAVAPQVLLLDEAFSHMDETLTRDVWAWLTDLQRQQGWTMLCVSHHPGQLDSKAVHRYALGQGRLVELNIANAVDEIELKRGTIA